MKIQEIEYHINMVQSLLWQYSSATQAIEPLVFAKQDYYDRAYSAFWENWVTDVFNLVTANEFGLAVWSIILNLPLFIPIEPQPTDKPIFGFNELDGGDPINDYVNFERGNFYPIESAYKLTIEEQRLVLRLRYYELVSNGAMVNVGIPAGYRVNAVNDYLKVLFADYGPVYALDGLDMSITYVFLFPIKSQLLRVLMDYNILPRPAGVKVKYRVITGPIFGFNELLPEEKILNTYVNFERGTLRPPDL